ncbi:hypothetical protein KR009_003418, partial [Drosophila setifemur]
LVTPNAFWPHYIDRQMVPPTVADILVKAADPKFFSPLSNCSKLLIHDASSGMSVTQLNNLTGEPCPPPPDLTDKELDHNFLDIMIIARQRRLRCVGRTFDIKDCLPKKLPKRKSKKRYAGNKAEVEETKPEVDAPPEPSDPPPKDASDPIQVSSATANDFEMVWKKHSAKLDMSCAEALQLVADHKLAPHEVILKSLQNFWHDDLEIQIETKFFHVNRFLFTHFARNFAGFTNAFLQIPVAKVQMNLLTRIYDWMLGDSSGIQIDDDLIPFFVAAKYLGIQLLVDQYWATFARGGNGGLWEQNAFHTYLIARESRCEDVMALMLGRVRKCFLPVVASLEFLEFDANQVACLLRQDTLCVNSEDEVFFACVRWLEYSWKLRKEHMIGVLASVRFPHLSGWLRFSLNNKTENQIIEEIVQHPQVSKWLWEANKYCHAILVSTSPEERLCSSVKAVIDRYSKSKCPERYWVYCPGVAHHHDNRCPRFRELTYETFKRFLHRLHSHSQIFMDAIKYVPNKIRNSYRCCPDIKFRPQYERICLKPPIYMELKDWSEQK